MNPSLHDILASYDDQSPLDHAHTIPASWYVDARVAELERQNVFGRTWQVVARADQVQHPGEYVTTDLAGEPLVVVRGNDHQLRAFYNVCRHHAAAVVTEPQGTASILRCPYHGWSYGLDGSLKGTPEFDGVCSFDRGQNGLLPVRVETWEQFVFVSLDPKAAPLADFLGGLVRRVAPLNLGSVHFFERRSYILNCNWKVFVDNYL
ncbi:MAG: aromatic ring-hydroxylating dioxygenase subunit alpha, partial [Candidatus Korobacteraceae bacterium]